MKSVLKRAYLELAHGQVHYRFVASSDKPWIILLHQSPSSSVMFESLAPFLVPHFNIVAPDNAGFGASDPLEETSVERLAQCVLDLSQHLEIKRAYIFGHHTGAAIGAFIAANCRDFCMGLAMCGPPALTPTERTLLPSMAPIALAETNGAHFGEIWRKLRSKETQAPLELSTREVSLAFLAARTREAYQAVADYDFLTDLAKIECAVYLFAGERDSLIDYLPKAQAIVPNARFEILPDAGGYVCDLKPDLVANRLIDFFLGGQHG